jgi:hypothetical protein
MAQRRWVLSRALREFWIRAFAAFVLLVASPGGAPLLQEVAELVTGEACCDDGCDDGPAGCGADGCAHCACCAHVSAVPAVALSLPARALPYIVPLSWFATSVVPPGYRELPFRPPLV